MFGSNIMEDCAFAIRSDAPFAISATTNHTRGRFFIPCRLRIFPLINDLPLWFRASQAGSMHGIRKSAVRHEMILKKCDACHAVVDEHFAVHERATIGPDKPSRSKRDLPWLRYAKSPVKSRSELSRQPITKASPLDLNLHPDAAISPVRAISQIFGLNSQ